MIPSVNTLVRFWNSRIPPRWKFVRVEGNSFVFLHPTKGFRKMSLRRFGVG